MTNLESNIEKYQPTEFQSLRDQFTEETAYLTVSKAIDTQNFNEEWRQAMRYLAMTKAERQWAKVCIDVKEIIQHTQWQLISILTTPNKNWLKWSIDESIKHIYNN